MILPFYKPLKKEIMKGIKLIMSLLIGALLLVSTGAIISTTGLDPVLCIGIAFIIAGALTFTEKYLGFGLNFVSVCGALNADILKDCDYPVQAGTRDRGVIINFEDILSVTYAADLTTVTDIILVSGAVAHQIDGQNNSIEPLSTMVVQGYNRMFDHSVMMKGFDISPETKVQVNSMKDGRFVIVTENYFRGVAGNAAFEVYGISTGLELMEIERNPNSEETGGAFHFLFSTDQNKEPKTANTLFITDYAASKAVVDGLL